MKLVPYSSFHHLFARLLVVALAVLPASSLGIPPHHQLDPRDKCIGSASLIFNFTDSTFIENLQVLPDGRILFTTLDTGILRVIDPRGRDPSPRPLVSLPSTTGLSGIARLSEDIYAVTGGVHTLFAFEPGSMRVFIVDVSSGRIRDIIGVPKTAMMNGLVALPNCRTTLLSADSLTGSILRIDLSTRRVDVAFSDPLLNSTSAEVPLGVNGLRIRGQYLYFTNSGAGTFGRVPIDDRGNMAGKVEIVAQLSGRVSFTNAYDDFDFDRQGNAYLALHSTTVSQVSPSGKQVTFAGCAGDDVCDPAFIFREPTSVALDNDGKSLYVSTGGNTGMGCSQNLGGQLIRVPLS
ncbi:hypothetical protein B0I35DRAFT_408961 [Stachybotrys elegans]|uniref:SMP-30/Gluconolactonase/LRE-like region domain-containing protein n=1 Tax=Stachybotrys elegans TaxID=80388 RepID=A0A8K0SUR8_9HYPO|nr:hypothetical protein B0I35DRAFT_408961 [Stachybotrys elegans]